MSPPISPTMHRTLDWDAIAYSRLAAPQLEWGRRVLARLAPRGDENVLDAGCGSGGVTAELVERLPGGRVIAVDRSPAMLRESRARFGSIARVLLVRADLAALPLHEAVDAVFSNAALHWVLDHRRLFREIFTALAPGGRLEAEYGGGPNLLALRERADLLIARPEYAPHFAGWREPWHFADPGTTAIVLRAAGFVEVHAWLEPAPVPFPDEGAYREYVARVVLPAYLTRLAVPALRESFLDSLVGHARHDDPPWHLDYWRLNVSARRPA